MNTLDLAYEHALLASGDTTPLRRAQACRLPLESYLASVYPARTPGPLAVARQRAPHADRTNGDEARARAVLALLAEGPRQSNRSIARQLRCSTNLVRLIRAGVLWPQLPRPWEAERTVTSV